MENSNYTRPRVPKTPTMRVDEPANDAASSLADDASCDQQSVVESTYEIPSEDESKKRGMLKTQNKAAAVGKVVAGAVVGAAGLAMLVLPGPGIACVAVGALLAGKGVQELTGIENPVITQVEEHPEYQAAMKTAKDAADSVKGAVNEAAKQVPDAMVGAGKAMFEAVDNNLPPSVKEAVDTVAPVVKNAADTVGPVVKSAADAVGPMVKNAAEAAAPVVKAAGEELNAGVRHLSAKAKERFVQQ